jgi:hypothetical protein
MVKGIYIWFKGLSEGARIVLSLVSFTLLVIGATLAIDHFKTKVTDVGAVIDYLKKDSIARDKREHFKDSVETKRHAEINSHLDHISDSLKKDFVARDIFQANYSHFVWDKFGNEWMKYMNGMSVTVVQSPYDPSKYFEERKPEYKIMIEKVDTTKRK